MIKFKDPRATLIWSFRYALGCMTYATSMVADDIIDNWDELNLFDKMLIKSEIKEAISLGKAGMSMDVVVWKQILELDNED